MALKILLNPSKPFQNLMEYRKKLRKGRSLRCLVAVLCLSIPIVCLLFLLILSLPEDHSRETAYRKLMPEVKLKEATLGELGELMLAMLPDDLAFTVFVPSEEAFSRMLNLRASESLVENKMEDTSAILSRVMGFSAIPRHLPSGAVPIFKEISFDSVSGYRLHAWKAPNGTLVINNVRSELVNLKKGETIVHIMSGVIMDPELEQSFLTNDED